MKSIAAILAITCSLSLFANIAPKRADLLEELSTLNPEEDLREIIDLMKKAVEQKNFKDG